MNGPLLTYYAHKLVIAGMTPGDAAREVWDECRLHGDDRQAFVDHVEAAHITPTGTEDRDQ